MQTLTKQVVGYAAGLPEGTPLVAKQLLHLGNRAAVDQALSRLVRRRVLLRAGRGIYALPVESRFGSQAPSTAKMIERLAEQRGETIVTHGAAAANALGLTTHLDGAGGQRIGGTWLSSFSSHPRISWMRSVVVNYFRIFRLRY